MMGYTVKYNPPLSNLTLSTSELKPHNIDSSFNQYQS